MNTFFMYSTSPAGCGRSLSAAPFVRSDMTIWVLLVLCNCCLSKQRASTAKPTQWEAYVRTNSLALWGQRAEQACVPTSRVCSVFLKSIVCTRKR